MVPDRTDALLKDRCRGICDRRATDSQWALPYPAYPLRPRKPLMCHPPNVVRLQCVLSVLFIFLLVGVLANTAASAQESPYGDFPDATPPYFRVRYEASTNPGELIFPVSYTLWVPEGVARLRGLIVHQHGCGEGSCRSGITAAYDLHWQALAKKHACGLLAPVYEQPQDANCQMWCDPRNGSRATFDRGLRDLAKQSLHPELPELPLALWGHSGGGHWCGGMLLLEPQRIIAAWLRSGVPLFEPNSARPQIKAHALPSDVLSVPIMCNLGTKEGVTVTKGRFSGVWPANQAFFRTLRRRGALLGVAIDPLTSHECGNSRYLAIPWLDKCLALRLPEHPGQPLREVSRATAWLAEPTGTVAKPAAEYAGDPLQAAWLPDKEIAAKWMQYRHDSQVADATPPPAPRQANRRGRRLTWEAEADLESGLAKFIILRDGKPLAEVSGGENRFGRQLFQNLQYSDTPTQPLIKMEFIDDATEDPTAHHYAVISVNTVGLRSESTVASP